MNRHVHSWSHIDDTRNRFRCDCGAESYRMGSSFRVVKPMRDWTIERDEDGKPVRLFGGVK